MFSPPAGEIPIAATGPRLTRAFMQTIGERLLEARQRRGVSIREAAESTKVRGDYLMAMEANQFDSIPLADVYKRGFLKIYARFLRLDSDRITGEYNGLLAARIPHGARIRRVTELNEPAGRQMEMREPEAPDEFASGAIEFAQRPDGRKRAATIAAVIGAAVIILTIVAVNSCGTTTAGKPAAETPVAAGPVMRGELRLTCKNSTPMLVRLMRRADNTPVFERTMRPEESVVIAAEGPHELYANPLDKIHWSVNGAPPNAFRPGSYTNGTIDVPPKK